MKDKLTEKDYQKISYSQCGEDIIINFLFKALKIFNPTYIDIGAYDPYEYSNTALLYRQGSKGINIEPNPVRYKKFLSERCKDINLNLGISDKEGIANLQILSSEKMSTFVNPKAEGLIESHKLEIKEVIPVKVTTINKVIDKHCKGVFPDLLSLDVEGMDLLVLKSIDWEKYSPFIICVETASYSTNGNEIKDVELISFLERKGYIVYADTRINTIFVKKDKYVNHP